MEHLDFIVWMIGFPLERGISEWLRTHRRGPLKEYGATTIGIAALVEHALWLGIGYALW